MPVSPPTHPWEIRGHPTVQLDNGTGQPTLITVCASCERIRTVLFLSKDRWFCSSCKAEGATPPNMYPIA